MRLHELEENKTYIGEDGREYKILDNHLCYLDGIGVIVVTKLSTLTQDFTPKKVKRTIEERCWLNKYQNGAIRCHATKESADMNAGLNRIACIEMVGTYEIEVEE